MQILDCLNQIVGINFTIAVETQHEPWLRFIAKNETNFKTSALPHCWYSALTRVIDLRIHPHGTWFLKSNAFDHCSFTVTLSVQLAVEAGLHFLSFI